MKLPPSEYPLKTRLLNVYDHFGELIEEYEAAVPWLDSNSALDYFLRRMDGSRDDLIKLIESLPETELNGLETYQSMSFYRKEYEALSGASHKDYLTIRELVRDSELTKRELKKSQDQVKELTAKVAELERTSEYRAPSVLRKIK